MKISVFYDHILQAAEQTGKPLAEILKTVKQAGICAVEIRLEYLLTHEGTEELLEQAGLGISCIYEFYEMNRCDEKEHIRKHIETAARVGAGKILVVPGFLPEEEAEEMQRSMKDAKRISAFIDNNESVRRMINGLAYAVCEGNRAGITVTVEDFDGRTSPLSGMYGILYILGHVPGLKYTLDTGNFVFNDEDVLAAWDLLRDKIAHVHCKDRGEESRNSDTGKNDFGKAVGGSKNNRNRFAEGSVNRGMLSVAVGDGYMPIDVLIHRLKGIGYDDFLAIEHFDANEQEKCMVRSADFLRKTWRMERNSFS